MKLRKIFSLLTTIVILGAFVFTWSTKDQFSTSAAHAATLPPLSVTITAQGITYKATPVTPKPANPPSGMTTIPGVGAAYNNTTIDTGYWSVTKNGVYSGKVRAVITSTLASRNMANASSLSGLYYTLTVTSTSPDFSQYKYTSLDYPLATGMADANKIGIGPLGGSAFKVKTNYEVFAPNFVGNNYTGWTHADAAFAKGNQFTQSINDVIQNENNTYNSLINFTTNHQQPKIASVAPNTVPLSFQSSKSLQSPEFPEAVPSWVNARNLRLMSMAGIATALIGNGIGTICGHFDCGPKHNPQLTQDIATAALLIGILSNPLLIISGWSLLGQLISEGGNFTPGQTEQLRAAAERGATDAINAFMNLMRDAAYERNAAQQGANYVNPLGGLPNVQAAIDIPQALVHDEL